MLGCDCSLGRVWDEGQCCYCLSVPLEQSSSVSAFSLLIFLKQSGSCHQKTLTQHHQWTERNSPFYLTCFVLFLFYLTYVTESVFDGVCGRHDLCLTTCHLHNITSVFFCLVVEATSYSKTEVDKCRMLTGQTKTT